MNECANTSKRLCEQMSKRVNEYVRTYVRTCLYMCVYVCECVKSVYWLLNECMSRVCICMRESMFYRRLLNWYHFCVFALSLSLFLYIYVQFYLVCYFLTISFLVCNNEQNNRIFLYRYHKIQWYSMQCDALTAESAIDMHICTIANVSIPVRMNFKINENKLIASRKRNRIVQ